MYGRREGPSPRATSLEGSISGGGGGRMLINPQPSYPSVLSLELRSIEFSPLNIFAALIYISSLPPLVPIHLKTSHPLTSACGP